MSLYAVTGYVDVENRPNIEMVYVGTLKDCKEVMDLLRNVDRNAYELGEFGVEIYEDSDTHKVLPYESVKLINYHYEN